MRSAIFFCAAIAAMFFSACSSAKPPKIIKGEDAVAVKTRHGVYIWFTKEKRTEFLIGVKVKTVSGVARITLDENDKPAHAMVITENKIGGYDMVHIPKGDANNAKFYQDAEKHIAKFIKENKVKQILQKYKK